MPRRPDGLGGGRYRSLPRTRRTRQRPRAVMGALLPRKPTLPWEQVGSSVPWCGLQREALPRRGFQVPETRPLNPPPRRGWAWLLVPSGDGGAWWPQGSGSRLGLLAAPRGRSAVGRSTSGSQGRKSHTAVTWRVLQRPVFKISAHGSYLGPHSS